MAPSFEAAGAAYIVDTLARAFIADDADVENLFLAIVAMPSVVGELWFTVWLLRKGGMHLEHAGC